MRSNRAATNPSYCLYVHKAVPRWESIMLQRNSRVTARIGQGIRDRGWKFIESATRLPKVARRKLEKGRSRARIHQAAPGGFRRDKIRGAIRLRFGGFKVAAIRIRYRARGTPMAPMPPMAPIAPIAPMAPMAPISSLPLQIGVPTPARSFARIANIWQTWRRAVPAAHHSNVADVRWLSIVNVKRSPLSSPLGRRTGETRISLLSDIRLKSDNVAFRHNASFQNANLAILSPSFFRRIN